MSGDLGGLYYLERAYQQFLRAGKDKEADAVYALWKMLRHEQVARDGGIRVGKWIIGLQP